MNHTSHPATLVDVAAHVGVSVGTASKALRGRPGPSAITRAKVKAAAVELGFRPNSLALALRTGRTLTVALLTGDSVGLVAMPILVGAEAPLDALQIAVVLCNGRDDPTRERNYIENLLARRVDGMIVAGTRLEARLPVAAAGVPVVYAVAQPMNREGVWIVPDDQAGGRLAIEHLLAHGRTRIGHITGPPDSAAVQRRIAGASMRLTPAELKFREGRILHGDWSETWGREAAHRLLRSDPDIDAIFCGSDEIGRGVCDVLRDCGRRIPEDVAVIGYDNLGIVTNGCRPPLTSIEPNLEEVGRLAAEALIELINGVERTGEILVPPRLVARQSTGPLGQPLS